MQTTLKFDIRNYVDHNFDFNDDDDEELTGMLHELISIWILGNGTGMLPNILQGDLFEEVPRRQKSGFLHPVTQDVCINVEDHKSFCEALYQLQKIDEREIVYSKLFHSFVICTEQEFLQVARFISKDLNVWTCMRLVDLVETEESRTISNN